MKRRSSFSILCFVLITFHVASISAQTCVQNGQTFIPNGTYDSNRKSILSSLPSNVAAARGRFYDGSIGVEPNRVYTVGMCIPGSSPGDCSNCIKSASDWLRHDCPNQTDAYYWALDPTLCFVRYSRGSFLGSAAYWEINEQYTVWNIANVTSNIKEFTTKWEELVFRTIASASTARSTSSSSDNHYSANVAALTKFQNMNALMQCTPDISPGDCGNCLRQSVIDYQSCCMNKIGGYVMRQICFFRWQFFTFSKAFANISLAPPPLQSPVTVREPTSAGNGTKKKDNSSTTFSVGTIVLIVALCLFLIISISVLIAWRSSVPCWWRKSYQEVELRQAGVTTICIRRYTFEAIENATKRFSDRIGRGGFGEVFKGKLLGGREIAVKRLIKMRNQDEKEFMNEVGVVAKLRHNNLVTILGYCVEREEKILVYEYVPNRSLDYFLFDPTRQGQLDWTTRYKIIEGIGSGIIYLHKDSGLKVIHRDLKVANILLDANMNPKIADFGMARIFGMDLSTTLTSTIVGTIGYAPPEYLDRGEVSIKLDIYCFGVLVLEIIRGRMNSSFPSPGFIAYALRLWREGSPLDLVDPTIANNSYSSEEVKKCINIALLCVQKDRKDRPDMSKTMLMLTNSTPIPQVPENATRYYSTQTSNSGIINDET